MGEMKGKAETKTNPPESGKDLGELVKECKKCGARYADSEKHVCRVFHSIEELVAYHRKPKRRAKRRKR